MIQGMFANKSNFIYTARVQVSATQAAKDRAIDRPHIFLSGATDGQKKVAFTFLKTI